MSLNLGLEALNGSYFNNSCSAESINELLLNTMQLERQCSDIFACIQYTFDVCDNLELVDECYTNYGLTPTLEMLVGDSNEGFFQSLGEGIKNIWHAICNFFKNIIDKIKKWLSKSDKTVQETHNTIQNLPMKDAGPETAGSSNDSNKNQTSTQEPMSSPARKPVALLSEGQPVILSNRFYKIQVLDYYIRASASSFDKNGVEINNKDKSDIKINNESLFFDDIVKFEKIIKEMTSASKIEFQNLLRNLHDSGISDDGSEKRMKKKYKEELNVSIGAKFALKNGIFIGRDIKKYDNVVNKLYHTAKAEFDMLQELVNKMSGDPDATPYSPAEKKGIVKARWHELDGKNKNGLRNVLNNFKFKMAATLHVIQTCITSCATSISSIKTAIAHPMTQSEAQNIQKMSNVG